jgi:hypothetical protein
MLYDEHRKLGRAHFAAGFPRYQWSEPALQEAYDKGYFEHQFNIDIGSNRPSLREWIEQKLSERNKPRW